MCAAWWCPDAGPGTAIVLAEDKKYYPTAEETFGQGTETLVMEEDAQPLETPIIAPVISKKHEKLLEAPLATHYSNEFLATLSSNPELIRNVAVRQQPCVLAGRGRGGQGREAKLVCHTSSAWLVEGGGGQGTTAVVHWWPCVLEQLNVLLQALLLLTSVSQQSVLAFGESTLS